MRTKDIQRERWPNFFNDFTQLHQGEHVNVETMGGGSAGVKSQLCNQLLVGIVDADAKDASHEWIELIVGDSPQTQASHRIGHPSRVVMAEEDNGQAVALQIESSGGSVTVLRFEPPKEGMPQGFMVE